MSETAETRLPRLAIFEPNGSGHRLYYVRLLAQAALDRGCAPEIITSQEALSRREWSTHLRGVEIPIHTPNGVEALKGLSAFSELHGFDRVVVPDADRYILSAARGHWKAEGILSLLAMRPDSQRKRGVRSRTWSFAKKFLIFFSDHRKNVRTSALTSRFTRRRAPLRWITDPVTLSCSVEQAEQARTSLDPQGQFFWVGVFGAVTVRKNLDLIARAVLHTPGAALLVAGAVSDDAMALARDDLAQLVEAGRPVEMRSETLADAEFDAMIAAVDCVAVAHSNEGSSGIVGKAHAANRRLLLAGARSLRADANSIGDSALWSELDVNALAQNLRRFLSLPSVPVTLSSDANEFVEGLL